jgi:hypothetical protein
LITNKKNVNIKYQISHNLHIENLKKTLQIFFIDKLVLLMIINYIYMEYCVNKSVLLQPHSFILKRSSIWTFGSIMSVFGIAVTVVVVV